MRMDRRDKDCSLFFWGGGGDCFAQAPEKLSSQNSGLEAQNLFVSFRMAVARSEAGASLHISRP
jgi:hypothetical protein